MYVLHNWYFIDPLCCFSTLFFNFLGDFDQVSNDYDSGIEVESTYEQKAINHSTNSIRSPLSTHKEQNVLPLKIHKVGNTYACMTKDLKRDMKVRRSKAERSLTEILNHYTSPVAVSHPSNIASRFTFFWEVSIICQKLL